MKLTSLLIKQIYFFCLMGILFACNVRRKDALADDKQQRMEQAMKDSTEVLIIDSLYNFRTIKSGDVVSFNFRFKNIGNKPLVINEATAGCGCTIPEKPEKPIKPGEIGVIKATFNSKGKSGHQDKFINVQSNVRKGFPVLKITGEVISKEQ